MSFRQEKKIDIVYGSLNKIFSFLSCNGFIKSYPDRKVFSCYFDTINFAMFGQSEEGVIPRKKIRIRWYNNLNQTKFYLEKKITLPDQRFKNSFQINSENFKNFKKNGYFDKQYGICHPKILITYNRAYFYNSVFRVTLDTNITYIKYGPILENVSIIDKKPVMEVKYDTQVKQSLYNNIFFFKESRFSKYSRGVNLLKDYLKSKF